MKAKITLATIPFLLLVACGGGGGDSDSGAGGETASSDPAPSTDPAPTPTTDPAPAPEKMKIACKRTPASLTSGVKTGDVLTAKFTVTPTYSGTAKLLTACSGIVTNNQSVVVSNGKFNTTGAMPASCTGNKTFTFSLAVDETIGSCGWSRKALIDVPKQDVPNIPQNIPQI